MAHSAQHSRGAAILGGLVAAATLLAGCAAPGGEPSAPATPPTTAAPTPAATTPTSTTPGAEPTASAADAEPTTEAFTTQNGTATIDVPTTWTIDDRSEAVANHDDEQQWMNDVWLIDEQGREILHYGDGPFADAGAATLDWEALDERPLGVTPEGAAIAAVAWWVGDGDKPETMNVGVAEMAEGEPPWGIFREVEGRAGTFVADVELLDICTGVSTLEAAEACLTSDEVGGLMTVLESLQVHDVPWDAMP